MATARELYVYEAMLAEDAERYDEMMEAMNKALDSVNFDDGGELTTEERNLLAIAYKNVIGARRSALRVITTIEQKEINRGNVVRIETVSAYKMKIEKELSEVCHNILKAVDTKLLISTASALKSESKVFYLKMKGDYNRYLAEFKDGAEKKVAADNTLSAYEAAQEIAHAELPSTNPIRLGLALNFAVFYYEILSSPERACTLAKQAFDEAIPDLDGLGEEAYRESTLIMQLLRDNLTLWTSDLKDDGSDEIPEAPKAEALKAEALKVEAPKAEALKPEALKADNE